MTYQVNKFPKDLIYNLAKSYAAFICVCRDQHINNDIAERFFAEAVGAVYRKTTALADGRLGDTGWSIKTRYVTNPISETKVSVKLTTRFLTQSVSISDATEIGSAFLNNWNRVVCDAKKDIPDMRTLILLHERTHQNFSLIEFETKVWNPDEFYWEWSGSSSIHGFHKISGKKQFAVHLNDSRLYIEEHIEERLSFQINVPQFNRETLLKQIAFTENSIKIIGPVSDSETPKLISVVKRKKKLEYISNASLDLLFDELVA